MDAATPAVHRTIVCADVAGFGDRRRTNPDQIEVRDGLYSALRQALNRSGVPWRDCYHEDRGDGVLVLVPSEVPKNLLVTGVPRELAAALAEHNQAHDRQARIRLRLALHAGEIHHDEHGVASTAINTAFRLLEAGPLKQALADSSGTLAMIASQWFYEEVIWHTPASAPGSYRRVQVSVKETTATAWICRPDDPYPPDQDAILPSAPMAPRVAAPRPLPTAIAGFAGRAAPLRTLTGLLEEAAGAGGTVVTSAIGGTDGIGKTALAVHWAQPDAAALPVSLAPRPALLAGREDLLADLGTRLSAGDGPWPRIVVLCGLGGAGKTSVAAEYAHRHLAEVGVAWQFAAGDPAVLAAGFGKLAAQLGARDVVDLRDPVASVHAVLAKFPVGWLLIFDNAADLASVAAFLPPAGPGWVLITSQNPNWPPGQALEVPVLAPDVAAEFLVNRAGDPDRQTAVDLAGELGGLPLALEQAAAYMQAAGDSLAGYLALFRQRRLDLLARGQPTGYRGTVVTTWALAFGQLEQSAPAAAGLLRLLACCAPEAIPLRLLLQPRRRLAKRVPRRVARVLAPLLKNPVTAGDAIAALRRYSLISPAGGGSFSVHRLVQAVTLDQMPADLARQWRQATAAVIEAALPEDPAQPDTWPDFAALLPHAQAALTADSDGLQQVAAYLGYSGSYVAARKLSRGMLDEQDKVLGPEHPDTLATRHRLARWTGEAGDAGGARDQLAALLPVRERVLGPEHPGTLATRASLAWWTGEAGDAGGARDQLAALLPVIEGVLGPEHPGTLVTRASLARWTGEAGDAGGARDQLAALLPVIERVLGPEHPDTLATRQKLARWTGEAGDAGGARDQLAALLPVRERVSGPEHPGTLVTRANLARWTGEAGDAGGARDQLAALLPVRERVLGPEHPDTLATRHDLARWTGEAASSPEPGVNLAQHIHLFKGRPQRPDDVEYRSGGNRPRPA